MADQPVEIASMEIVISVISIAIDQAPTSAEIEVHSTSIELDIEAS